MPPPTSDLHEDLLQQLRADLVRAWPALQGGPVDPGPFTALAEAVGAFVRAAQALGIAADGVLVALHTQLEIVTRGEPCPRPFAHVVQLLGVHSVAQSYHQEPSGT
jgi:hypothetical protein